MSHAHIATTRLGLGACSADLEAAQPDPEGWLRSQLGPRPIPPELSRLKSSSVRIAEFLAARELGKSAKKRTQREHREVYRAESAAREAWAARTPTPFRERLVGYWSNHFTVSTTQKKVTGIVGAYEREAIRPRITGRFADLLVATTQHPAMLVYLDNLRSTGPDSRAGQRRDRGLNENLAREVLELHTLGADGGYTQDDVIALARILTGWTLSRDVERASDDPFRFSTRAHDPGTKTLLGRKYGEGLDEGLRALNDLADHPSTARNVSRRFAKHFLSDDPPESAVRTLQQRFEDTGGDLRALADTLIGLDATWQPRASKLKTPRELVLSTARLLSIDRDGEPLVRSERALGQQPFSAPSPQGWSDNSQDWAGPQAILDRVDWAHRVAALTDVDPASLADVALGPDSSRATRRAIASANRIDGTALLLASPEFQRR